MNSALSVQFTIYVTECLKVEFRVIMIKLNLSLHCTALIEGWKEDSFIYSAEQVILEENKLLALLIIPHFDTSRFR